MNDEFLYRYRQRPRPEFVESLGKRISAEPGVRISFVPMHKLARNVMVMGIALLLLYSYSPDVRGRLFGQIARMG
jgi:hypothetical protein